MTDPYARTPQGFLERIMQRIEALESRLSRILPTRLGPLGQQISDWNDATAVGFYWGAPSIPNSPEMSSSSFSGIVYYDGNTSPARLMQEARLISNSPRGPASTWRRSFVAGVWTPWTYLNGVQATDFDLAIAPGFYWGDNAANSPANGLVTLLVEYAGGRLIQTARPATVNINDVNGMNVAYRRVWNTTSWTIWAVDYPTSDTGWIPLTPGAGWSVGGGFGYKVRGDTVRLRGEFWGGTSATPVFTLPTNGRPLTRFGTPVTRAGTAGADQRGNLAIETTGIATFVNTSGAAIPTSSPGYSLGAINFPND